MDEMPETTPAVNQVDLLATTTFSEVSKNSAHFEKDAIGIMNVIKNRTARPERFGESMEDVIYAPSQFSGVGTAEWNKAANKNFTDKEEKIYKRLLQLGKGVWSGDIADNTGGADHYYNPKLVSPNWAEAYDKTYSSGAHDYHSELKPSISKKTKLTFNQAFAKARKEKKKVFSWKGKKYTTKLAE